MHAKLLQLCPTLCNTMVCSPPGSSVHEMLQARKVEWVAIFFSRGLPDPGIKPWSLALQVDSLKPCLSKGFRNLISIPPLFWDRGDTTQAQKGFLWVKSQGITPGHNESCSSQKPSLPDPCWPRGVCTPRGGSQGRSGVEKESRQLA